LHDESVIQDYAGAFFDIPGTAPSMKGKRVAIATERRTRNSFAKGNFQTNASGGH